MSKHEDTEYLNDYLLNEEPDVGDEFTIHVLSKEADGSLRVSICRTDRDCETLDFMVQRGIEERIRP